MITFSSIRQIIGATVALLAVTTSAPAQLRVTTLAEGQTVQDLVDTLIGQGVVVFNVQYRGATNAAGLFCNGQSAIGFNAGVVLTTGNAENIVPPNNSSGAGQANGLAGDADLEALVPGVNTEDACVLEFDFIPAGDQLVFNYVFASEEYNEFVDSAFNDVFGLFVNGVNVALVPGSTTAVAINNVNNGNAEAGAVATGPCNNCAFYVDNASTANPVRATQMDGLTTVLQAVATVNPGQTNRMKFAIADGTDQILDSAVFIQANSFSTAVTSTSCVTRTARYWFTHVYDTNATTCASLVRAMNRAIAGNCDLLDLGFLTIPTRPRYNNVTDPAELTAIEALGFYYRGAGFTGEPGGTQMDRRVGSVLCRDRKRLAVELIAAIANVELFGTDPSACQYRVGTTWTNFPPDLITQARQTLEGFDPAAARTMTLLLRKFNNSGVTNPLPVELTECSPQSLRELRVLARDPTTQDTCPGRNDGCATAQVLLTVPFSTAVNLTPYTDAFGSTSCGSGGRDVVWKLAPPLAAPNRHFTIETSGSNFDTLLSVWTGSNCSNLTAIACDDNGVASVQSRVGFRADGTNTYYIVAEGANGQYGRLRLRITSP